MVEENPDKTLLPEEIMTMDWLAEFPCSIHNRANQLFIEFPPMPQRHCKIAHMPFSSVINAEEMAGRKRDGVDTKKRRT